MIHSEIIKKDFSKTDFSPLFIVGLPRSGTKLLIADLCSSTYFYNLSIEREKIENELFFKILETNSWQIIFKYILNDLVNYKKNNFIFGDKTPRYLNSLEILHGIYPSAKFLHIVRDPRDQCISARKVWKKSIYRSAQIWKDSIENAREVVLKSNLDYLEVKYEDLLEKPKVVVTEICKYLNCEYHPSMLVFNNTVEGYGEAKGLHIIKKDNYNKFQHALGKQEIKKIEQITFTIMRSLKYNFMNNVNQVDLHPIERLMYKLHDFIQNYIFHIKEKGILDGIRYVKSLSK